MILFINIIIFKTSYYILWSFHTTFHTKIKPEVSSIGNILIKCLSFTVTKINIILLFNPFCTIIPFSLLGSILGTNYDISLISILPSLATAPGLALTLYRALSLLFLFNISLNPKPYIIFSKSFTKPNRSLILIIIYI